MSYGVARAGLVLLTLGGAWVTALTIMRPVVVAELPAPLAPVRPAATPAAGQLDHEALQRAVGRPLFRADRRTSSMRYDPERAVAPEPPAAPPVPKPALAISGIVWGDQPAAVVEGVPGTEGSTVLRPGESSAGLKLVSVNGDRVVIRGMDTTWRLTVRDPWK